MKWRRDRFRFGHSFMLSHGPGTFTPYRSPLPSSLGSVRIGGERRTIGSAAHSPKREDSIPLLGARAGRAHPRRTPWQERFQVCPSRAYNSCAIRARRTLPPTCSPACRAPTGRPSSPAGPCACPSSIMPNLVASRSPGPPWWMRRARRAPPQCAAPEYSVLLFVRADDRRSAAARRALVPLAAEN